MSIEACLALLREGDPDRFAMVAAAPPEARPALATLYAANLGIARAAVAPAEPMLAQIRLQWWVDQLDLLAGGGTPTPHEVLTPLSATWGRRAAGLLPLAAARQRDAEREAFTSDAELLTYLDACTGTLVRMGCEACGWSPPEDLAAAQGRGAGLAAWLSALPALRPLGLGLRPESGERVSGLARKGLEALDRASAMSAPRHAAAALYAGPGARRRLEALAAGRRYQPSPFRTRLSHAALALAGRWRG